MKKQLTHLQLLITTTLFVMGVVVLISPPQVQAQTCVECCTTISIGGCVPQCTAPFCGQDNGCGGICPDTDGGQPPAPTTIQPSGTYSFECTDTSNRVVFSWNGSGTLTERYQVRVYPQGAGSPDSIDCAASNTVCTTTTGTTYTYLPTQAIGRNITLAVRAVNNTCVPTGEFSPWATTSVSLEGEICGTFYLDNAGTCSGTANGPTTLNSGSSVVVTNTDGSTVTEATTGPAYTVGSIPYAPATWPSNIIATLNIVNTAPTAANYLQLAACNNASQAGLTSPDSQVNWYVQQYDLSHGPWWQSRGGLVFGKNGITTEIPAATCQADPAGRCVEYLVTKDLDDSSQSAGVPLSEAAINAEGYYSDRRPESNQPRVAGNGHSHASITRENYAYFTSGIDLSAVEQITQPTLTNLPAGVLLDGAGVSYRNGSLTIDAATPITVSNTESKVIFVNGDVTIRGTADPVISVQPGGFLAFIVSGNITIAPELGHTNLDASAQDANLEGIYVADGVVRIPSKGLTSEGDNKLVIAGTVVGWGGIELNRDFAFSDDVVSRAENNTRPTETFVFRPDLLLNTPDLLKRTNYVWQEVN